ncbi:photosynthesis system II assembly factor Ycf48 [Limnoraphis robusta]|uniref:Photosystem II assembly protein Ycf48 n=1 Tax=Limnoraphis robusta CS-951 TaxID=1637645 RepID=A0A0F5YGC0_9CYAN|nr:photosynthesis system II assembly factor Ycf48 [Limnoraphis robusta]KKD37808.1 photosystem II assembly protein [Limnoraphis robusta CS-951]
MSLMKFLRKILIVFAVLLLCTSCKFLPVISYNPWEVVPAATDANLFDVAFSETDPNHGWVVGSNATLLETTDGGKTWETKALDLGEEKARLASVSFSGSEGWVVGEPSVLLHTTDDGNSWTRIQLSSKLPGAPYNIVALGPQSAEMTTDIGAIYATEDGGTNWKALVEEAVGVVRSIARSSEGEYMTVSAKGNFYSTWTPGEKAWQPHNRYSSKRLENIGFGEDGRLWMIARGGELRFADPENPEEWSEVIKPEYATSWGLLDLAYRTPSEIWVSGGSGNLVCSFDGGETWLKDREVENIPANFNRIKFINPDKGFILGQRGTLLRYTAQSSQSAT